jgi:DNA-directed RNA polymerase subunit N (RpoN/RPB10)
MNTLDLGGVIAVRETEVKTMRCLRCGGLMSCDWFTGGVGTDIAGASETWRCVNCGEIIDDVIFHNRRTTQHAERHPEPAAAGRR